MFDLKLKLRRHFSNRKKRGNWRRKTEKEEERLDDLRAADQISTVVVVSLPISLISITLARTHTRLAPPRQLQSHPIAQAGRQAADRHRARDRTPPPRPPRLRSRRRRPVRVWQVGSPGRYERARLQVLLHHQKGGDPRAQGGAQLPVQGHPPCLAVSPLSIFLCDLLCTRIGWPGSRSGQGVGCPRAGGLRSASFGWYPTGLGSVPRIGICGRVTISGSFSSTKCT